MHRQRLGFGTVDERRLCLVYVHNTRTCCASTAAPGTAIAPLYECQYAPANNTGTAEATGTTPHTGTLVNPICVERFHRHSHTLYVAGSRHSTTAGTTRTGDHDYHEHWLYLVFHMVSLTSTPQAATVYCILRLLY